MEDVSFWLSIPDWNILRYLLQKTSTIGNGTLNEMINQVKSKNQQSTFPSKNGNLVNQGSSFKELIFQDQSSYDHR